MMPTIPLFPEPLDLDAALRDVAEPDFLSCAFLVMGIESSWRVGLDQTARLLDLSEARGGEWLPLYRLVSLLVARAETFDRTSRFLDEMVKALKLLPARDFALLQEIKMAHLHKVDPQAWTRAKNKAWLEGYRRNWYLLATAAGA